MSVGSGVAGLARRCRAPALTASGSVPIACRALSWVHPPSFTPPEGSLGGSSTQWLSPSPLMKPKDRSLGATCNSSKVQHLRSWAHIPGVLQQHRSGHHSLVDAICCIHSSNYGRSSLARSGSSSWAHASSSSSRSYSVASAATANGTGRPLAGGSSGADALAELLAEMQKDPQASMTPAEVVERLDRFIVGQADAKKAVAVAFRNRWRRHRVAPEIQEEIVPKNILMIGPTGCGKTEIARRLAKLADAPFVKVEATKFTEVGYHGRDVDMIIRDLLENAMHLVRSRLKAHARSKILAQVEEQLVRALAGPSAMPSAIEAYRQKLRRGELEDEMVEVELPPSQRAPEMPTIMISGMATQIHNLEKFIGNFTGRRERRTLPVSEARGVVEDAAAETLFPPDVIAKEAIRATEQDGIVFIDEIDKIVESRGVVRHGTDPSSEGVQRDLLPIIEGSVVTTKHGPVSTDHILFICSGAFHSSKPSDMLPELQGRLPIRVELKGLTAADFERILTEPEFNMIKQQQMLLAAEGVDLAFSPAAVAEVARVAELVNSQLENIGARRLHTVLERLVEEISFDAPDRVAEAGSGRVEVVVDDMDVREKLGELLEQQDLSKYIL